jgi:4-amino-4-deoxy-L-arabinose transferase-like glycosyltransferase
MVSSRPYSILYFLITLAILVNFTGLFVPLMDPDAGVYASISRNMVQKKDWLDLFFQDKDWLDKPHLPFWITAIFFKCFGMHAWSYKLPGVLFVVLSAGYTYLFAKKFYNETIALWSVFILLTAEHILISNNDVRAEPYLTGLIIASIYHFSQSLKKGLSWPLVWGSLFAAMAMMTKGLFTLAPIAAAVGGQLILTRQWKQVFHWRWLIAIMLVVVFIFPELYALWFQFDSHPDKIVFGKDHVSGIRFFLWDSQFGRFTNTGPIKGKGDPSFFLHTLLWAFLPWCVLMYTALVKKTRATFNKTERIKGEWYMFSATVFTLLIFSVSKFQLPYYTNIIFPMLSVLTATIVVQLIEKNCKLFTVIQIIICTLLLFSGAALFLYYRPGSVSSTAITLLTVSLLVYIFLPSLASERAFLPYVRSGLSTLIIALFLNLVFYPDLLRYQSGNQVAFYINQNFPNIPVGRMSFYMPSGEFYLEQHMQAVDTTLIKQGKFPKGGLLYVTPGDLSQLDSAGIRYKLIKEFPEFHITMLSLKFLDPKTREKELKYYSLVQIGL